MKIYQKEWQLIVPGTMAEVWTFFSRPENLEQITPADMKFEIIGNLKGIEMYPGILIHYKVSPFSFLKTNWVTEITAIKDQHYFIDEQRFGPFNLWHHQHHFEAVPDGVLMKDILQYAIPYGPIGRLINQIIISRRIDRIFEHRQEVIHTLFPG